MNSQMRYGLAAVLAAVLLGVVMTWLNVATADASVRPGPTAYLLGGALSGGAFVAGIVLLIVGLVRRPSTSAQQSQRD